MFGEQYNNYNFPDLIKEISKDNFFELKQLIIKHENKLVELLKEKDVDINSYENLNDFIRSL
jgi:hypothetical protein